MITKAALTRKVQKIMNEKPTQTSFRDNFPTEFIFLKELFSQHYDAALKMRGFEDIEIHYNKVFNNRGFVIINEHKQVITISYKECITPTKNKADYDFKQALRCAISEDVAEYFKIAKKNCEFCESTNFLQVDHIKQFKNITRQFIDEHNINPKDYIFSKAECNRPCFSEKDRILEREWRDFHNSFPNNFRILCRTCNIARNFPSYGELN